jgi:predicted esterase
VSGDVVGKVERLRCTRNLRPVRPRMRGAVSAMAIAYQHSPVPLPARPVPNMLIGYRACLSAALLLIATAATHATAQSAAPQAPVTRADLGNAYLRLDRVVAAQSMSMDDSLRARVNRAFDASTLAFFGGRFAAAVGTIDSLTVALSGAPIAPIAPMRGAAARIVDGRAPSVTRDALLARLARIDSAGPLAQALVSARARAGLLVDVPSRDRSAEFLADPVRLAAALQREVSALERGRNPYAAYAGDLWRSFRGASNAVIPFRIVASREVARSKSPVPVLFAFHGAGADENIFVDAYGAGITAEMAQSQRVLLVSPSTTMMAASPANFDTLLAHLRTEYNIDTTRVYVIGHSMGAGLAARLASQRPAAIAAVVCLAGGAVVKIDSAPPMLFIGAELDPVIPARTVRLAASGTPTATYQELRNEGHTLMVGNGIRIAFPWMLERHR